MSTSSKPAVALEPQVQPFPYAEVAGGQSASGFGAGPAYDEVALQHSARQAGIQEGEARAQAAYDKKLAEIRDTVRVALDDFARERSSYYQRLEAEVVQLALSIARKILHREAQLDPNLLAGIVRVALEKIESGTRVTVRVNPQQVSECRSYFAQHMDAQDVPEVVDDPAVPMDQCRLQTKLGTTELGLEVQIKEIEQGLFDLLAQRPPARP